MSKELADRFERDLSASNETKECARRARQRAAALDIDWERAFEVYYAQATQDPKRFVRFPGTGPGDLESPLVRRTIREQQSNDDERYEPATSR